MADRQGSKRKRSQNESCDQHKKSRTSGVQEKGLKRKNTEDDDIKKLVKKLRLCGLQETGYGRDHDQEVEVNISLDAAARYQGSSRRTCTVVGSSEDVEGHIQNIRALERYDMQKENGKKNC